MITYIKELLRLKLKNCLNENLNLFKVARPKLRLEIEIICNNNTNTMIDIPTACQLSTVSINGIGMIWWQNSCKINKALVSPFY